MKTLLTAASAALIIAFASPAFAGAGCGKTGYRAAAKVPHPAAAATPAAPAASAIPAAKDVGQAQGTTAPEQMSSITFSQAQGGAPSRI
jgi:hypothetical protein